MDELVGGRFRVGEVLGSGGQGTVVEAFDERLQRPVALKLVQLAGVDGQARQRYLREAQSAAAVSHPNVVTVFDIGDAEDERTGAATPYLAMELVRGPSLARLLAERGPLGLDEALQITDQVLAGLSAAHDRGLVHRDIKPSNVLLARDGTVKISDFGLATSVSGGMTVTQAGQVMGTVSYLAPERVSGRPATVASDLYAVGVVLYEMLAGQPPYAADTPVAVAVAHQSAPIPSLADRRSDLPGPVVAAVERALAKDPAERFESAAQMRRVLQAATTGPVAAAAVAPAPMGATRAMPATPAPSPGAPTTRREARSREMRPASGVRAVDGQAAAPGALAGPAAPGRGDQPTGRVAATPDSGAAPDRRRPSLSMVLTVTAGVALVAVLVTLVVASLVTESTAPASQAAADPAPAAESTSAPTSSLPATSLPSSEPAAPQTIGDLTDRLADGPPEAYGERGDDLLERLQDIQGEDPEDRPQRVQDTLVRVARWTLSGNLDRDIARETTEILAPMLTAEELAEVRDRERRDRDEGDDDD